MHFRAIRYVPSAVFAKRLHRFACAIHVGNTVANIETGKYGAHLIPSQSYSPSPLSFPPLPSVSVPSLLYPSLALDAAVHRTIG